MLRFIFEADLQKVALEFLYFAEHIFIFSNNSAQVSAIRQVGYQPTDLYRNDAGLKEALDRIDSGFFSPGERSRYHGIFNCLVHHGDHYLLLADYADYIAN